MKKRFCRIGTLVLILGVLWAALCGGASAARYESDAQILSGIGVFRGTAGGFELDRAPTRSEAAIMLVRLYGAETAASEMYAAGTTAHPFTDVSAYTSPYVAWLYTNGITKGTSASTFGSQSACTMQNYVVFLLRALGYQDGADFSYADALSYARSHGIATYGLSEGFLRDDLALLTLRALGAGKKDGSGTLLDALIRDGAVDGSSTAAASLRTRIDEIRDEYAFLDRCLSHETGVSRYGQQATLTVADVVVAEKMTLDEAQGHPELFPLGNTPYIAPGDGDHLVWIIQAETGGTAGGLPSGSIRDAVVDLVADAATGEPLESGYHGPSTPMGIQHVDVDYVYDALYIRTDVDRGGTDPVVTPIDSREAMDRYIETYGDPAGKLARTMDGYPAAWYGIGRQVLMVSLSEPSGSVGHQVTRVTRTADGQGVIEIGRTVPSLVTDDEARWEIAILLETRAFASTDPIRVEIHDA